MITDVEIWNPTGQPEVRNVVLLDGVVKELRKSAVTDNSIEKINGRGKVLMPMGVDPQVHFRTPGQPEKETPETGARAALFGGVGAVLAMPNTKPIIDSPEVCQQTREIFRPVEEELGVKILLSAAITLGQRGKEPVDFAALAKWGVAAFTDDGVGVVSDDLMRKAFKASAETGIPILQHAEVPGHKGVLAAGAIQTKYELEPYPPEAESDMVERDLNLLEEYRDARYHVLHVSSIKTLRLVEQAKENGLNVTCEVSPHHLFYTSDDIQDHRTAFKMNPPLRFATDRAALRIGLREHLVDFVATDHAPHEASAKGSNFKTAAYGTTGLEASLKVLFYLYQQKQIRPNRLVQVFCKSPAKFLGVDDQYGSIEKGRTLRALLVDPNAPAKPLGEDELFSKSKNSCFLGARLPGKIHRIFNDKHWYA